MMTKSASTLFNCSLGLIAVVLTLVDYTSSCPDRARKTANSRTSPVFVEKINFCPNEDCNNESCADIFRCGTSYPSPIKMTIVNSKKGKLNVTYNMKQRGFTNIRIDLYACESITDYHNCASFNPCVDGQAAVIQNKCGKHSSKFIELINYKNSSGSGLNNETCEKDITVTFDYVYTSCYYIEIYRCDDNTGDQYIEPDVVTFGNMIETKYKKEFLVNSDFKFSVNCDPKEHKLLLRVYENVLIDIPKTDFVFGRMDTSQTLESLHNNASQANYPSCSSHQSSGECCYEENKDSKNGRIINCIPENITNEMYFISVTYFDLRCRADSVWTKPHYVNPISIPLCKWFYDNLSCTSNNSNKIEPDLPNPDAHYRWPLILCVISFIIIGLIICAVIALYCKNESFNYINIRSKYRSHSKCSIDLNLIQSVNITKVMLIYARDCDSFQNVMEKLKNLMRKYNFQIFDFWDDKMTKDLMFYGCEQWVEKSIKECDLAIVVATECAVELERRNLCGINEEHYLNPQPFDRLFKYALCVLKDIISCESQMQSQKVFVIRLDNTLNQMVQKEFIHLSRSRHSLPSQLHTLILDLKRLDRRNEIKGWNESNELSELKEAVDSFTKYAVKNPDYLRTILHY